MKFSSGCLIGILLGIVLSVLAFFGYTLFISAGSPPLLPAASVGEADVAITINAQYLNDQIRKGVAARGMNVSDLTVALHAPNRADVTMTMDVTVLGRSINVRPDASFHFGVSNGARHI